MQKKGNTKMILCQVLDESQSLKKSSAITVIDAISVALACR